MKTVTVCGFEATKNIPIALPSDVDLYIVKDAVYLFPITGYGSIILCHKRTSDIFMVIGRWNATLNAFRRFQNRIVSVYRKHPFSVGIKLEEPKAKGRILIFDSEKSQKLTQNSLFELRKITEQMFMASALDTRQIGVDRIVDELANLQNLAKAVFKAINITRKS